MVLQSRVFFNEGGLSKEAIEREIELSKEEMDHLEEPYLAHELVGPIGRPGEKPIAGTIRPKAREEVREG